MKVLTKGHKYAIKNFEDSNNSTIIQFIEKEPIKEGSTELKTINDGITNEDLLDVLIDRLGYLQSKFPCKANAIAITNLEETLMWLEKRTRDKIARGVEGTNQK